MKINNPLEIKDSFRILNEQHRNQIFKLCDQQGIKYNTKTIDRWNYPVEVKLIKPEYFKGSYLAFGWKE